MNARPELNAFPGLRVRLVYARALLAEDEAAGERFEAAIGSDFTRWPLYRARLLLEYGIWLRRRRKIADARSPLRAALQAFMALGAVSWAERARMELRASRESRVNPPEAWDELTEQEWQIAELAAEGLSNREIAQRLYVSHRTVGSHLYHIFPKLGVSSRSQLSAAIRSREPASLAG
jgi:ATP/maltotriose-dependent transcriptional regulator MalT